MNNTSQIDPPSWPLKLVRGLINPEFLEEIEGDLYEVFQDNVDRVGRSQARMRYTLDCFKLIRPSLLKRNFKIGVMGFFSLLRNNLKVATRVLQRDRLFTFVNVLGMGLGLVISLLILLYAFYEFSYESYNPESERLVRVTMDYLDGETLVDQDCETYPPLGPRIVRDIPEATDFVRVYHLDDIALRKDDKYVRADRIFAVDSSFQRLFNYPFLYGDPLNAFHEPNQMALTESQAVKYFGKSDAVGELLWYSALERPFEIIGILPDPPTNTHLKFNVLISLETLKEHFGESDENWDGNNTFTYIQLNSAADYPAFESHLADLNDQLILEEKIRSERVIAQPVKDIHLYSHKSFEAEENGDAKTVWILLGVALLVILIAVVNYINLSTSKSLDRAKEVGIRKVIGSSLGQLRWQFFTESLLINLLSGTVAIILIVLVLPYFKTLSGLPIEFSPWVKADFWITLLLVLGVSTVLSGLFPAFVLSGFRPVSVLNGNFSHSKIGQHLRKGLVVFQFAITTFLLVLTLTIDRQLDFLRSIDLGLNTEHTLVVEAPPTEEMQAQFSSFKQELLADPEVISVGLSSCVPGLPSHQMGTTTGITLDGDTEKHNYNFYIYSIDHDFLNTMQMELLSGDDFRDQSETENVLVNEAALALWRLSDPSAAVGLELNMWGGKRQIQGVFKNFHQGSAKADFLPMIFLYNRTFGELASVRVQPQDARSTVEQVRDKFERVFPGAPFEYFFLDQEFDKQYRADAQFRSVFSYLTIFAILIACMGLFGLVSFSVAKRRKEIGVRKVLGASTRQLVSLLSGDFLGIVSISILVAMPLTYLLVRKWLTSFANRINLEVWIFAVPAVAVLTLALLTTILRTSRLATSNPVVSLRDE